MSSKKFISSELRKLKAITDAASFCVIHGYSCLIIHTKHQNICTYRTVKYSSDPAPGLTFSLEKMWRLIYGTDIDFVIYIYDAVWSPNWLGKSPESVMFYDKLKTYVEQSDHKATYKFLVDNSGIGTDMYVHCCKSWLNPVLINRYFKPFKYTQFTNRLPAFQIDQVPKEIDLDNILDLDWGKVTNDVFESDPTILIDDETTLVELNDPAVGNFSAILKSDTSEYTLSYTYSNLFLWHFIVSMIESKTRMENRNNYFYFQRPNRSSKKYLPREYDVFTEYNPDHFQHNLERKLP